MSPEAERKLAAILSADVVGYSRLMAEDEAGTIRTVTAYREQIATLVREHRGRVVDSPGDNLLAEFPTALDAVQAAVEIQRVIGARNADLPAERRMEFRIGVHLGDVAIEGGRIYGDGVNIAARLEGIAEAGGICTSATVYEQVERKLDLGFEDLGKKEVKNIAKPVRVYRVALQSPAAERETPSRRRPAVAGLVALVLVGLGSFALWRACGEGNLFDGRPMIAVLRFCSLSGEAEQYLADGMAEDLITRLSNWGRYPVIARNSSFTFDGCAADMRHISEELGARYVVEGSLRKAGDQIRVTAQLIDAATGAHVWAETYDREYQDIFAIQDEVTEKIASSIVPGLRQSEIERAAHPVPTDLAAYDLTLRGWWHHYKYTPENNAKARRFFEQAIEKDPPFADPFVGLAWAHVDSVLYGWSDDPQRSLREGKRVAEACVALDPRNPECHRVLGWAYSHTGRRDEMLAALELAVELNPSDARSYMHLASARAWTGQPDQAIANVARARKLNPKPVSPWSGSLQIAWAHMAAQRYEEALAALQRSLQLGDRGELFYRALAATYAQLGRAEEARAALGEARRLNPSLTVDKVRRELPWADPAVVDRYADGLRKAGLPEE